MNEQRSPEWHADRSGKWTGSKFVDVLARNKKTGEPLKAWHDLVWQVVVERLTGQAVEGPSGYALQWGTDVEPFAREAYELETGNLVTESGFIQHPDFDFAGCSPDGLIGADGGLEMKCPKSSAVHLERFLNGVPEEYIPQIQGCMWVTGRKWWDFVSYDPRMPESHRLLCIRVDRDEVFIKRLENAVMEAEARAIELMEEIMSKADDQRGKTEDATHAVQQATELPQAPAASTPPIQLDDAMIDDFLLLLPIAPQEKKAIRAYLVKFEKYRIARAMQEAA